MVFKVLKKQNNSKDCFICGTKNKAGMNASFYECLDENEQNVLIGIYIPKFEHQSYPNRMHGGMISAILDEAIGRTVQIDNQNIWGVTMDMYVKFKKPVPLKQSIYSVSKINTKSNIGFKGSGYLCDKSGVVLASADATYFIMPPEKISPVALDETNWYYVDEKIPKIITIGE
ncbi:MAG: PaaI family thioesterase [Firmicutes bacterium]|nr:PaaI family thioesterase [Bacillota bacterium]